MVIDMNYWTKVAKRIIFLLASLVLVYLGFKLAVFYIPFLIAFIISLLMEPAIKFIMKKTKLNRKTTAIILFLIVLAIIIGLLAWGIVTLISETSNLLSTLNDYFQKASNLIENILGKINWEKIKISPQIIETLKQSAFESLGNLSQWLQNSLSGIVRYIKSIPRIGIYIVITFLALYLIITDKIYMLDQLEHHLPKKWVNTMGRHIREFSTSLGKYLKAEITLVFISFVITLAGLYIFSFVFKLNINYPLLIAIAIGFVDMLPIFGSGTIMIPWAVISSLYGDYKLGIAIFILWIIISITRQLIEPHLVSGGIGVHPIFTLITMYTGFKIVGIWGLIAGPIVLIIIKNIYSTIIEKGLINSILED